MVLLECLWSGSRGHLERLLELELCLTSHALAASMSVTPRHIELLALIFLRLLHILLFLMHSWRLLLGLLLLRLTKILFVLLKLFRWWIRLGDAKHFINFIHFRLEILSMSFRVTLEI